MAKKEFRYRGYTSAELKELPVKEFVQLLPARERRSFSRGFTPEEQSLLKKLEKKDKVKTHQRQMVIYPGMIGKTISVHNGKEYVDLTILEEMVGDRLGQFVLTRKKAGHTGGGIGGKKKNVKQTT